MSVTHPWACSIDKGRKVDALLLDFAKAFDTVPHRRLLAKLHFYKIYPQAIAWISDFLSNRSQIVRVDGASTCVVVRLLNLMMMMAE